MRICRIYHVRCSPLNVPRQTAIDIRSRSIKVFRVRPVSFDRQKSIENLLPIGELGNPT